MVRGGSLVRDRETGLMFTKGCLKLGNEQDLAFIMTKAAYTRVNGKVIRKMGKVSSIITVSMVESMWESL